MSYSSLSQDELEIISCKFLHNLPTKETTQDRIWFHLQKCYFYYLDQITNQAATYVNNQTKDTQLLQFFTCLQPYYPHFIKYEPSTIAQMISCGYYNIPVCGSIILNNQITKVLLVQCHQPEGVFGLPKGKINEGQTPEDCASREVYEEVGLSLNFRNSKKIEVVCTKPYIFYLAKVDQNQPKCKFSTKQIKSFQWFDLVPKKGIPKDVHLNLSARMVFQEASASIIRQKNYYDQVMKKAQEEQTKLTQTFQGYNRQKLNNLFS